MDILKDILRETELRVQQAKATATVVMLESLPAFSAPTLSLEHALRSKPVSVIGEVKKASPSRGLIRADFDVSTISRGYRRGGAAAVSVLTEPNHFKGSLMHLAEVRRFVDLPVLRKDFIVDPYQLIEARAFGADATLLIAAALERDRLHDLLDAASELGLECLVEVHSAAELSELDLDRVRLLGINNRDLTTFEVDVTLTARLLPQLPAHLTVVSESGLHSGDQLAQLCSLGVHGFLIGEALMKEHDVERTLRSLLAQAAEMLDKRTKLRLVG
ncbi:MAG TPA: indole-3-glycerol phosphate synthase TrpC [Rhodothermales bacterium]|nr:indole-3-glycerol phosphate synthase TrpC [Rhodothermales bacterium]